MRNDILQVITDAESKAEGIILTAKADAEKLIKDNNERIDIEKSKFLESAKKNYTKSLSNLENKGQEIYSERLKLSENKALSLKENATKHMDDCVKILVKGVLDI